MNKKEPASLETKNKIIQTSKLKFSKKGYDKTSLNEIVEELGLTRGALYHYFTNKKDLFHAVLEEVQTELANYVESQAIKSESLWGQLEIGCIAFVEYAIDSSINRILLIDGPAVLSWATWKTLDKDNSQELLVDIINELQRAGEFKPVNKYYAATSISGGLNELALNLSHEEHINKKEVE